MESKVEWIYETLIEKNNHTLTSKEMYNMLADRINNVKKRLVFNRFSR